MRSIFLFALLVGIAASSPILKKRESASCPASSGLAGICIFIPGYNCVSDDECTGGKVCCSEGCGRVCKSPVAGKREVVQQEKRESASCPASSGLVGICVFIPGYNCISDDECTGGKVCCSEGCGRVCKAPVAGKREVIEQEKRKSASCPASSGLVGLCVFIPGYNCISDDECTGGKVCCSEGCGRVCKAPVVGKREVVEQEKRVSGSCPASSGLAGICVFVPGYNCVSDSECTAEGKLCCSEGCGKICKSPVTHGRREVTHAEKRESGSCPASSGLAGFCVFVPGYNCVYDSECAGEGKLCCSEGCGKICKSPVTHGKREVIHAGSCPKVSEISMGLCVFRPGFNCLSDQDCALNEKCCHQGCGRICKVAE